MLPLQTFILPFAFWFKPGCVCVALCWLVYRASLVINTPLDDLASLLGFDIPLTPAIDLASIKSDGAIIHWSLPQRQKHKSTVRFEIHLNGHIVDTVSIHESAVTITGLQPGACYVVRVALVNHLDFSSRSPPIRFRTKPASSGDCFVATAEGHELDHDASSETLPHIRLFRGLKDIMPASMEAAPMVRDGSVGMGVKRSLTGRRLSPAAPTLDSGYDYPAVDTEPPQSAESVQQLTEKLDAIRRETDETERLAKEEEEEELRLKEDLVKERDELKAEAMDKEKASRNLKREVNILERQNTAAQNERSKQERLLQQKKQERQKLRDDVVRWEREAGEMKAAVEQLRQFKIQQSEQVEREKEAHRNRQADEAATSRALDEEIREKTADIKRFERAMKDNAPNGVEPEPNLVQQYHHDAEDERRWGVRRSQLQQQYAMAFQKLEAAKSFHTEQARYLESLRADRRRQEELAQYVPSPPTQDRLPRRGDSQRQTPSGHSSDSPRLAAFAVSQGAFSGNMTSAAPFPAAPFMNIHNGMTISGPTAGITMSEEDREKLTGGAPMSPGAGADLLPADLFNGDGDRPRPGVLPLPGLGALPGLPGLPGPIPQSSIDQPGPASPASASSRSPSVFASPQASSHNLHIGSPENYIDSDRRSIRSTRSNRATSGGGNGPTSSRFSGMFGIKQRHKATSTDEGPALGKAQSHSMPRQDQGLPGLDSLSRKRNSSISGAVFGADLTLDGTSDAAVPPPAAATRRRAFGFFGKDKGDGWPSSFTAFGKRPESPRPGSTHSNELPRPSMDSSRWGVDTWPSGDASTATRSSPLAFGPGWSAPVGQSTRLYGSKHPSRRPSVQYGASGPPEDIMEDDDSDVLDPDLEPQLAPIGTKPSAGSNGSDNQAEDSNTAKLNPAAKDFKSLFSSMRGKDKEKKGSTGDKNGSSTPVASTSGAWNPRDTDIDESPPNSRKSRDTRSLTTTESSLAESGRNSSDLVRTTSYSNNSDAPSPVIGSMSSTGKESFMQKITRKSSSGKFSLSTFKREKNRLDPSSATAVATAPAPLPPTPAEDDEDDMSTSISSLKDKDKEGRESKEGSRVNARNWGNVLKLGKRKGGETPSVSGLSMASGTEDDDGVDDA